MNNAMTGMEYGFSFAHPWMLVVIPLILLLSFVRAKYYKPTVYRYPLTDELKERVKYTFYGPGILSFLRTVTACLMALSIARPQRIDTTTKVNLSGVDILLVLDVSLSMTCFDDIQDQRTRIEVAKHEALEFIKKRHDDQIGLVLFGKDAVSRCPLTFDKKLLAEIINKVEIGAVNPNGTALSTALALGVNRLRGAKTTSKIMIVLTDGEPTPEDIDPEVALSLAQKYGIKIYTIGIGSSQGGFIIQPGFGLCSVSSRVNEKLLEHIASQTGGKFYMAQSPEQIKKIYQTIDSLEKSDRESLVYHTYEEWGLYLLWPILFFLALEIIGASFVWFCL